MTQNALKCPFLKQKEILLEYLFSGVFFEFSRSSGWRAILGILFSSFRGIPAKAGKNEEKGGLKVGLLLDAGMSSLESKWPEDEDSGIPLRILFEVWLKSSCTESEI